MFSRNFMKVFPVRKYGNITAKSKIASMQPAAFRLTTGFSTMVKSESPAPWSTSLFLPCFSSPSITSTLPTKSSDTHPDPLLTLYLIRQSGLPMERPERGADPQFADHRRLPRNQQDETPREESLLREMMARYEIVSITALLFSNP